MQIVAINVGVNTTRNAERDWGGFRAPIFPGGNWKWIPYPYQEHYGEVDLPPPTYEELEKGELKEFVPRSRWTDRAFLSPDFEHGCYGQTWNLSAVSAIKKLWRRGGFLFFYATLDFKERRNEAMQFGWINPRWGAYLVGYVRSDYILTDYELDQVPSNIKGLFRPYIWYRLKELGRTEPGGTFFWIKGLTYGKLNVPLPLSDSVDPQKWSSLAVDFFRTNPEKKAVFQTVLTCRDECSERLWNEIEKYNPGERERAFRRTTELFTTLDHVKLRNDLVEIDDDLKPVKERGEVGAVSGFTGDGNYWVYFPSLDWCYRFSPDELELVCVD